MRASRVEANKFISVEPSDHGREKQVREMMYNLYNIYLETVIKEAERAKLEGEDDYITREWLKPHF